MKLQSWKQRGSWTTVSWWVYISVMALQRRGWGCLLLLLLATRHARRVYVGGLPPMANEQMWPDLISKSKEGGADMIQTYAFWNGHEPIQRIRHCQRQTDRALNQRTGIAELENGLSCDIWSRAEDVAVKVWPWESEKISQLDTRRKAHGSFKNREH